MASLFKKLIDPFGIGEKILGKVSGALEDKKISPEAVQEPSYYPQLREKVGKRLLDLVEKGPERYEGQFIAPFSEFEQAGLNKLRAFGDMGTPSVIGEGSAEISKTLANAYDPETSAYFQAFRNQRLFDLEQSKKRFDEASAGAGRFFHGARIEGQRKLEEQALRDINTVNAELAERERSRRLDVLPLALQYGVTERALPLQQIEALTTIGAKPRELSQAELDALRGEFLRLQGLTRDDLQQAANFAGPVPYAYPQYTPSKWMQLIQALAPAAGSAIGAAAACHVADLLYGPRSLRAALARFYVERHDSPFLRAYRQHSAAWAAWLKERPTMQQRFRPIWDDMVKQAVAILRG